VRWRRLPDKADYLILRYGDVIALVLMLLFIGLVCWFFFALGQQEDH
jgi:hypothetical protein